MLASWVFLEQLTTIITRVSKGFLVAQMVKNLPAMWETQVQSLSQEDPLEKGMATRKIP